MYILDSLLCNSVLLLLYITYYSFSRKVLKYFYILNNNMGISDNMYNFFDQATAIPGNVISGIGDLVTGGKDAAIGLFGMPQKGYQALFDTISTVAHTPTELAHSARDISGNAKDISENAKDVISDIKPILFIGILLIAFKTITEFDSQETGSNLARVAMFA